MRNILLRSLACMSLSVAMSFIHAQAIAVLQPQEKEWNHDMLIAKWKTGDIIYDLKKDGAIMVTISGRECPGTWTIKGNKVTIIPKKLRWKKADPCSKSGTLDIVHVNADGMDISDPVTEQELHLVKLQ